MYERNFRKYCIRNGLNYRKQKRNLVFISSRKKRERITYAIVGLNVLVFLLWQNPAFRPMMNRNFLNVFSSNRIVPLLGSAFSHEIPMHLMFNMFAFVSFSSLLFNYMTNEQYIFYYLSSGVFSSFISKAGNVLRGKLMGGSLGASGVLVGILMFSAIVRPETKVSIMFLPGTSFTIGNAVKCGIFLDVAGILFGWKKLDHLAHLGGYLYGYLYYRFLHKRFLQEAATPTSVYKLRKSLMLT